MYIKEKSTGCTKCHVENKKKERGFCAGINQVDSDGKWGTGRVFNATVEKS